MWRLVPSSAMMALTVGTPMRSSAIRYIFHGASLVPVIPATASLSIVEYGTMVTCVSNTNQLGLSQDGYGLVGVHAGNYYSVVGVYAGNYYLIVWLCII